MAKITQYNNGTGCREDGASSVKEVGAMLEGIAVVMGTFHDPKTGNNLSTERVARSVASVREGGSDDNGVRADECPLWLNRALNRVD